MTVMNLPNVQSDASVHVLEALAQLKEIVRIFLKGDPQHAMGAAANSATAN